MVYDILLLWSACNIMDPLNLVNQHLSQQFPKQTKLKSKQENNKNQQLWVNSPPWFLRPRCEAAPFVGGSQGCDPLTRCVAPRHWRPSHLGPSVWAFLRQVGLDGKHDVSYRFKEENQAIYCIIMFMYVYCYILYTLDICLFFCINIHTLPAHFLMRHKYIEIYSSISYTIPIPFDM